LMPMFEAALEQILAWMPQRIQTYCAALVRAPLAAAAELGYTIEDDAWRGSHLFGLRAPAHVDLGQLQHALQRRSVFASLRGSALRVSPNVYNNQTDLDALLDGLRAVTTSAASAATLP